ncbi:tumor necrosis factor alpha-inducing protein [Helicobacter cetorum MIT 00-7128]|uniref:Tumor necrosis factor alpha-inducing protein n=1 Tax=Helicobacter cetorum (strain ATCC BAA-429 / MIT 00-7128) TaxID=182217 RepID=I0EM37_HELC0|nr:tumor necrosis factor alpha-inducing protein [Helicobacter cetorum MIT 00-7128]
MRAKERVAYQITEKIHTVYVKSKDDQHKKHDFTVVRQIEGAILKGLKDNMEMLNKWVNPYNNEVFVIVRAKSYNEDILRKSLQRIPSLDKKTIDNILKAIAEIFNDSFSYDEANIPREM